MRPSLKTLCENCPKRTNGCPGMCKALERRLRTKDFKGGELSNVLTDRSTTSRRGKSSDVTRPSDYAVNDRTDTPQDEEDSQSTDHDRDETSEVKTVKKDGVFRQKIMPEPQFELDERFRKVLRMEVTEATFGKPKLRARFYTFLKCSKQEDIGRLAGVTKQSVSKQLAALIEKISRQTGTDDHSTPGDFKRRVTNPK